MDTLIALTYLLPMRTYRVPVVGVFLGHLRINLHQTRTQYSKFVMRDRNIAIEPNFQKLLPKSRILSLINSYLSIPAVYKQQTVAAAGRSIAMTSRPAH